MADNVWPDHPAEPPPADDGASAAWPADPTEAAADQPTPDFPGYARAAYGLADPLIGLVQLGAHAVGAGPALDQLVADRQTRYQQQRDAAGQTGTDWWRVGGNVASPVNFALPAAAAARGASLGARLLAGAEGGALGGMAQPVNVAQPTPSDQATAAQFSPDDYWLTKAGQAGAGATLGTMLGPLGRSVAGSKNSDVAALQAGGVQLTPGQAGGAIATANEALASRLPLLRNIVAAKQGNAIDSFYNGTLNQVLKPIGAELPDDVGAGHDAFNAASQKISDYYQNLMPQLSYDPNHNGGSVINDLLKLRGGLPANQQAEFDRITDPLLSPHAGADLKSVDSDLATFARSRKAAAGNPEVQDLGYAIDDARDLLRNQLAQTNPAAKTALDAVDRSSAMLKVVERATNSAVRDGGIATPGQILTASVGGRGASPTQSAKGNALLQGWAGSAQRVIGSSRSPGRAPISPADLLTTDIIGTALGVGGAGLGAGSQEGYLPDWARYAGFLAPAMLMTRPGATALSAFAPGGPVRGFGGGLLSTGVPAASGGLLGR